MHWIIQGASCWMSRLSPPNSERLPCLYPAPTLPPSSVKVTLIESDTALVSWKQPEEPNLAVTRYTILYASRQAWVAGDWQVLQREGESRSGRAVTVANWQSIGYFLLEAENRGPDRDLLSLILSLLSPVRLCIVIVMLFSLNPAHS